VSKEVNINMDLATSRHHSPQANVYAEGSQEQVPEAQVLT
jgi:hypothetical protein